MAMSEYLANAILNEVFKNVDHLENNVVYVGLHDISQLEFSGGNYQRLGPLSGTDFTVSNKLATFGTVSPNISHGPTTWSGQIRYASVWDNVSGGNMLFMGPLLGAGWNIAVGETIKIGPPLNDVTIQL